MISRFPTLSIILLCVALQMNAQTPSYGLGYGRPHQNSSAPTRSLSAPPATQGPKTHSPDMRLKIGIAIVAVFVLILLGVFAVWKIYQLLESEADEPEPPAKEMARKMPGRRDK